MVPSASAPTRHVRANGQRERPLSGETDADHGSPYEAHVRKSDGTELEVIVNKSFEVTAVNEMQHP